MTRKQSIFIDYLLKQLGFLQDDLREAYKENMVNVFSKLSFYDVAQHVNMSYTRYSRTWYLDCSLLIDELLLELKIKKNRYNIRVNENWKSKLISASDFSNYEFCPVSYCISKSLIIEHSAQGKNREIGNFLHEKILLCDTNKFINDWTLDYQKFIEVIEDQKITKIKNCKCHFIGHKDENHYFKNSDHQFVGQPDYIFEDPNGKFFVVEEKFRFLKKTYSRSERPEGPEYVQNENSNVIGHFFSNHIVQLQSYMKYIREYNISYGVLLYWYYSINEDGLLCLSKSSMKVLKRDFTLLEKVNESINQLINDKIIPFSKPSINKCASCVVSKYCAHKMTNLDRCSLPYDRELYQLHSVEFPEALVKKPKNSNK